MSAKIFKTDAEWRAQLSDEQYRVTRKHGTERPLPAVIMTIIKAVLMAVSVAGQNYFIATRNLIPVRAGRLLPPHRLLKILARHQTEAFSWYAQRYIARNVTLI